MLRVSFVALMLVAASTQAVVSQVPPTSQHPEITAGGRGEIRLAPDYAYVTIGVTTQSSSAVETASKNAEKIAAVISALRAAGLTERQIVTSGYSLTQVYEYPKNQQPRLTGFSARNTVRAEVRRLDDVGKVIDAAINSGATDIASIQFLASSTEEARRTALADAVRQARADADVMARGAGGTLGRLISMGSSGVAVPIMIRGMSSAQLESVTLTSGGGYAGVPAMAPPPPPTPVNPGELIVVAQVFSRWEFVPEQK
ncbi:MAG TPA: SIMPL domain-containing protein [Gemmatimonadaceae bacterium]|nr:SIMPL domain-containing protein [Gemmatimonadaceae bacterium]